MFHFKVSLMHIQLFCFNPIQVNTYVLWDDELNALIIDPGCYTAKEEQVLKEFIQSNKLVLRTMLNTHLHFDHLLGNAFVEKTYAITSQAHKDDLFLLHQLPFHARLFGLSGKATCNEPDTLLQDGDRIYCGDIKLKAIHVPGHSPGSLAFYSETDKILFSGDVLFREGIGRSDLDGGDGNILAASLRTLMSLPDETLVYPGHGPQTSIGYEKLHNPFF